MECKYCGNRSGKTDERGNCRSCGAPVEVVTEHIHPGAVMTIGVMTRDDARKIFLDMTAFDSTIPIDVGPYNRGWNQ